MKTTLAQAHSLLLLLMLTARRANAGQRSERLVAFELGWAASSSSSSSTCIGPVVVVKVMIFSRIGKVETRDGSLGRDG